MWGEIANFITIYLFNLANRMTILKSFNHTEQAIKILLCPKWRPESSLRDTKQVADRFSFLKLWALQHTITKIII